MISKKVLALCKKKEEYKFRLARKLDEQKMLNDEFHTAWSEKRDALKAKKPEDDSLKKKIVSLNVKSEELAEEVKRLKLSIQVIDNNIELALFDDLKIYMPCAFDSFFGKNLGQKTKDKLHKEFEKWADCSFYIEEQFSDSTWFTITSKIESINNIKIILNKKLLIDNKLQPFTQDDLQLFGKHRYIEDIDPYVNELLASYDEVLKQVNELEEKIKNFDDLSVLKNKSLSIYNVSDIHDDITY